MLHRLEAHTGEICKETLFFSGVAENELALRGVNEPLAWRSGIVPDAKAAPAAGLVLLAGAILLRFAVGGKVDAP